MGATVSLEGVDFPKYAPGKAYMRSCTLFIDISRDLFYWPTEMVRVDRARLAPTHWVGMEKLPT